MYFLEFSGTFGHSQHITKRAKATQIIKESRCRSLDNIRANMWTKGTTLTSNRAHLCLFMLVSMRIAVSQVQVHRKLHRCHWTLEKASSSDIFFYHLISWLFLFTFLIWCLWEVEFWTTFPMCTCKIKHRWALFEVNISSEVPLGQTFALTEIWRVKAQLFVKKNLKVNSSDHRLYLFRDLILVLCLHLSDELNAWI